MNEEVISWQKEKIKELQDKKDKTEFEESFLLFLKDNNINEQIRTVFFDLTKIFDYYMDDTPENIVIYSLWVIGTYFHKEFYSYPYLFLNAMRGSGKSRLLKLLAYLGNGKYTSSLTESIVFRTKGLLCVDELEGIGGKDKSTLRELLNASYKKGMTIMRTIKKKDITGETMKIEEFEPYRPIAMANIWGMEEVLGDRCISCILEKSDNSLKTRRMENFSMNEDIEFIKMKLVQCSYCSVDVEKRYKVWDSFLNFLYHYTNNINNINNTNYTENDTFNEFFNKIHDTNIIGRQLELFFPLFIIADVVGKDILETTLDIAKKINIEKKETEIIESSDVMVYNFISTLEQNLNFIPISELFYQFKNYSQIDADWFNIKWFGKALKRLNLYINKKRLNSGMYIIPNIAKAKEKVKMFK